MRHNNDHDPRVNGRHDWSRDLFWMILAAVLLLWGLWNPFAFLGN
jgi:hypothetical protein